MTYAQSPQGQFDPDVMVKKQTVQMAEDLGLNEEQTEKVAVINKKYSDKMGFVFRNAGDNREGMREKMADLRRDKNKELKLVLTEEQYKTYVEAEQKRMTERRKEEAYGPAGKSSPKRGAPRDSGK